MRHFRVIRSYFWLALITAGILDSQYCIKVSKKTIYVGVKNTKISLQAQSCMAFNASRSLSLVREEINFNSIL